MGFGMGSSPEPEKRPEKRPIRGDPVNPFWGPGGRMLPTR